MIDDLKRIFPTLEIVDCEKMLGHIVRLNGKTMYIDELRYKPICHFEDTEDTVEVECEECGELKLEKIRKLVIDVEVKNLSGKQKKEQLSEKINLINKTTKV